MKSFRRTGLAARCLMDSIISTRIFSPKLFQLVKTEIAFTTGLFLYASGASRTFSGRIFPCEGERSLTSAIKALPVARAEANERRGTAWEILSFKLFTLERDLSKSISLLVSARMLRRVSLSSVFIGELVIVTGLEIPMSE